MNKYIDAEELISKILKLRSGSCISESDDYYEYAKSEIIDIIESLRKKPVEIDFEDWDTLGYIRDIVRRHIRRDAEFNALDKWLTEHYVI